MLKNFLSTLLQIIPALIINLILGLPYVLIREALRAIGGRYLAWQLRRTLAGKAPMLVDRSYYGYVTTEGHQFEFDSKPQDPPPASDLLPMLEVRYPVELTRLLAAGNFAQSPRAAWQIARVGWLVYLVLHLEFPKEGGYAIPLCIGQYKTGKPLQERRTYLDVEWSVGRGFLSALKQSSQIGIGGFVSFDSMRGVLVRLPQRLDFAPYSVEFTDEEKDVKTHPHLLGWHIEWPIEDHVVNYLTTGKFDVISGFVKRVEEKRKKRMESQSGG